MTTKFKPGQVYCCRSSGDNESTLYLILEVKSIGNLTHVKFIKFENVGESAASTLTVRTCPTTHLSLGYTRIVKEQTKRELVLNLCTANCINTDKIKALWTQLDENKFEVGEVYTNAYYEALTHYLCVEINANNQPLFLDYNQVHREPFLAHEDILKRLQLIKDKDHRLTMLSNFEAAINQVISDCEKNRSKISACYFEQLWSELDRLDTTLVFQVGKVYQSFTTKEYFIVTKLLNNRPLLAPVRATHYITQTYSKEFIATLTEPPYPERLYQLSSIKVRVQQAIDEYSEYMRFIDNSLTLLSKENYQ